MTFTNLKKVVQICCCLRFVWVRFSKKNVILSNKENFFRPEKRHLSHVLKREYIDRIICLCCYHQILISLWSFTILDPLKHFLFTKGLKNTFSLPLLIIQFLQKFSSLFFWSKYRAHSDMKSSISMDFKMTKLCIFEHPIKIQKHLYCDKVNLWHLFPIRL